MDFGEKLYQLRKDSGITQTELARRMGVSHQSVSNWESGAVLPSAKRMRQLSEVFGVPMRVLLGEDDLPDASGGAAPEEPAAAPDSPAARKKRRLWIAGICVLSAVLLAALLTAVVLFAARGQSEHAAQRVVPFDKMEEKPVPTALEPDFELRPGTLTDYDVDQSETASSGGTSPVMGRTNYNFTVSADAFRKASRSAFLETGEVVTVNAAYSPRIADVHFGLIGPDGQFHYLYGTGGFFTQSMEIPVSGEYTFAVENCFGQPISVTGYLYD